MYIKLSKYISILIMLFSLSSVSFAGKVVIDKKGNIITKKTNKKPVWAKKIGKKKILYSDGLIREGGHRNWRNFNPGNLVYGKFAKEHGAIGTDGRFAIFPDMKTGFKAQAALLSGDKYRKKSIKSAIHKYAPSFENNTRKYISVISKKLGVHYSKKISSLNKKQMNKMVMVMAKIEGMKKGRVYKR